MANDDVLKTFGLLPEPKRRGPAFFVSVMINGFIITLAVLISLAHLHDVRKRRAEAIALTFPVSKPPEIVKPKIPQIKITPPPTPQIAKLEPPKITLPKPEVEPPKPVQIKPLPTPMPVVTPAPPKIIAPPPQPKVGLFSSPKPTDVANNKTAPSTHVGGFGDPLGAKANPNSKSSQVATLGSFGAAPGADTGAGAARKGAVSGTAFGSGVATGVPGGHDHGTVAVAGFQNGVIGGTGKPGGHGTVQSVGFAQATAAPPPPKPVEVAATVQPPKVLGHPKPEYTSDARQARIEGSVVLKVRFTASGKVQVLGVVEGLGHGLDEAAKRVAEETQFMPATQNGQPVDFTTTYRIAFQLA